MKITLPGQGRLLVRCLIAVFFAGIFGSTAWSEDSVQDVDAVFRGQSPPGWNSYVSRPMVEAQTFSTATAPWIVIPQQAAAAPVSYASAPITYAASPQMTQLPGDPFSQPYSGTDPGYADPGLSGLYMNTPAIWQPYVAAQGNFGNYESLGIGQLMMPLYQDGQTMFFADIRGRFDDSSNSEGNFGLAARTMIDPTWFVGAYGFYDYRRTGYGNTFNQGTVGIEAMSVYYEARMNGYIPESSTKAANSMGSAVFSGSSIYVMGGFERAYYGLDGEIGGLLWEDPTGNHELRGFVGGYWYDTNASNFPSVAGPKGRLEYRAYDLPWFGPGSRLTLGVEMQDDSVRDFQVAGIARLVIPIGVFQGARHLTRLERRMLDRIVRDNDIVTVAKQGNPEVGVDSLTNRLLNNVTFVDATTANIPLTVATAANPATSTVVVDGHAGDITATAPINLQAGQVFRGAGFQVIGSETGATATFGTRPTINNTNLAVNTVVLANNTTVADLNLTGGLNGISSGGANLDGIRVSRNVVSHAKNAGYEFAGLNTSANNTIDNNIAQSNGWDASNTLIPGANGYGFRFTGPFAGTLQGNISSSNYGIGYLFDGNMTGSVIGNTASGNGVNPDGTITTFHDGFYFGGTMTGTVSNNTASYNSGTGMFFLGSVSGTVTQNTSTGNGRKADGTIVTGAAGFDFFTAVPNTANITSNSAVYNAANGILFEQAVSGTVSNNTSTSNGGAGFELDSTLNASSIFNSNVASYNTSDGFLLKGALSGTANQNYASFNGVSGGTIVNANANGFSLLVNNSGTFTGNTTYGNANNGFAGSNDANFSNAAAGTFSNNVANQNGDKGYRGANAGTATNNTGSGNPNGGNTFP